MTEEEYITERLEDQLNWYDKKSAVMQKCHKRVQLIEITFAGLIPFVPALDDKIPEDWVHIIVGLLGIAIAVSAGMAALNKYQENWIAYRSTAEMLKHEKYLYLTKSSPYDDSDEAFQLLVERVEGLISKENSQWSVNAKKQEKKAV